MINGRLGSCRPYRRPRFCLMFLCLLAGLYGAHLLAWQVLAEGSRTLYPGGISGHRANIEWRNSYYGDFLLRRTLLHLYAVEGEAILLGSSAVGVGNGDILVYHPGRVSGNVGGEDVPDPATADFRCETQRSSLGNPDQGRITSRQLELAGPDTIDAATGLPGGAVANGYVPCFYTAPVTGIYSIVFLGPQGFQSNLEIAPTGEIDLTSPANFNENQATSVAAWDVTVRSGLTSTEDINGRLFADYLAMFTGDNPRLLYSRLYFVTEDGYRYQVDLRALDPNGFILYSNDAGFWDTDGTALYHDVIADPSLSPQERNQLNRLVGGVSLAPPTHLVFFNPPQDDTLTANNIPLSPIYPVLQNFEFTGPLGGNVTRVGLGGTFTYNTNLTSGSYQLVISRDGTDFTPDNPQNWFIQERHDPANQAIPWDGLDNAGNPFLPDPMGEAYVARMTMQAGEQHFPMLDIENSAQGGPTFTLINPPGPCPAFDCRSGFYDDRGYSSANGTLVGTPGQVLPEGDAPTDPPNSNLLTGFDTSSDQRRFGSDGITGFGDKKGLDLWTFFPSEVHTTLLVVEEAPALDLAISKTDGEATAVPGGPISYTLAYSNITTLVMAYGVIITETVPLYTTFNRAASRPTEWSCADGAPAGTFCTTTVGDLAGGGYGEVTFGLTVLGEIPAGVNQVANQARISDDGSGQEILLTNNVAGDTTPLRRATPTATPTVPVTPSSTPTPGSTPSGETDDGGDNDNDNDNDDGTPAPPPPASVLPASAPVPPLPVMLLPATGEMGDQACLNRALPALALLGLGAALIGAWRRKK